MWFINQIIALLHEGLFRISGSQENIRAIKDKFEKGADVKYCTNETVVLILL